MKQWCHASKSSPYEAYCIFYCKSIQCSNSGLKQPLNHAESKKHSGLAVMRFGKTQRHLEKETPSTRLSSNQPDLRNEGATSNASSSTTCVIQSPSPREEIATAEILWALKVAQSNYSYASCDETPFFKKMFPCDISKHFSMSKYPRYHIFLLMD